MGRGHGRIFESAVSWVARVSASFSLVALPAIAVGLPLPDLSMVARSAIPVAVASFVVAIASGLARLALLQSRRDVDTEFWSRVWTGRLGTFAFGLARKLHGAQPVGRAMTHRATELSLGMAAEQLRWASALVRRVPVYSLAVVRDFARLGEAVEQIAARLHGLGHGPPDHVGQRR